MRPNNAERGTRNAERTVGLAVSGHGFGHSVRCAEVARALLKRGARVLVRTDAPAWLFPDGVEHITKPEWPLDVGVAQHDGLDLDIDETRKRWEVFAPEMEERAKAEVRWVKRVDVLIGDIPPLAFAAAAHANVPSFALGNFAWDWIYAAWPAFEDILHCVRSGYAQADTLLRLPLHSTKPDAFPGFKRIEDVPLIVRKARRPRHEVRTQLQIPMDARVVLISFGGFNAQGLQLTALGKWRDYRFVLTPPIATSATAVPANVVALNEAPTDYVSLLAACDVVVTKPGYGIVADCLANRVAMLFTDRGPFREYDVLAEALPKLGRARYVLRNEVLAGYLGPHLDALLDGPADWTTERMDGADVVAQRVLSNVKSCV